MSSRSECPRKDVYTPTHRFDPEVEAVPLSPETLSELLDEEMGDEE